MSQKVLLLPGDGIGPSAIQAAGEVLSTVTDSIELVEGSIGRSAYEKTGQYLPHETLDLLDECKILLSGPAIQPENSTNPLTTLKVQLDLFARSRHFMTLAPDLGPEGLNVILWGSNNNISAEITEVQDVDGIDLSKHVKSTAYSRMMEVALANVRARGFERISCLVRSDFYPVSSAMFKETFEYLFTNQLFQTRVMNVKDWAARVSKDPTHDQCIICIDLYSHVVAGFLGGLAGYDHLYPTCYIGDKYRLYQPRHKSTIDNVDETHINPTSFILSTANILWNVGMKTESLKVSNAVRSTYMAGDRTPDVGGTLTTEEFTKKVIDRIE